MNTLIEDAAEEKAFTFACAVVRKLRTLGMDAILTSIFDGGRHVGICIRVDGHRYVERLRVGANEETISGMTTRFKEAQARLLARSGKD